MRVPLELDVLRSLDVPREPACVLDVADAVVDAMQDERRRADRWRDVAHVYLVRHAHRRDRIVRTARLQLQSGEPFAGVLVVRSARDEVADRLTFPPSLDDVL